MGYINFTYLYEKGLTDQQFLVLQKIFQKDFLLIKNNDTDIKYLLEQNFIQYLSSDKGKNLLENLRVSKKGVNLLNNISEKDYTDEIGVLLKNLTDLYERENKYVGNSLEVRNRLIWFVAQTGFNSKTISNMVEEYLTENTEYTLSLENLIWKPQSKAFSVHKNIKDSKLYDLICKKYNLDYDFFLKDIDKNKTLKWLKAVSLLPYPPMNVNPRLLFTENRSNEIEHINNIRLEYQQRVLK